MLRQFRFGTMSMIMAVLVCVRVAMIRAVTTVARRNRCVRFQFFTCSNQAETIEHHDQTTGHVKHCSNDRIDEAHRSENQPTDDKQEPEEKILIDNCPGLLRKLHQERQTTKVLFVSAIVAE